MVLKQLLWPRLLRLLLRLLLLLLAVQLQDLTDVQGVLGIQSVGFVGQRVVPALPGQLLPGAPSNRHVRSLSRWHQRRARLPPGAALCSGGSARRPDLKLVRAAATGLPSAVVLHDPTARGVLSEAPSAIDVIWEQIWLIGVPDSKVVRRGGCSRQAGHPGGRPGIMYWSTRELRRRCVGAGPFQDSACIALLLPDHTWCGLLCSTHPINNTEDGLQVVI